MVFFVNFYSKKSDRMNNKLFALAKPNSDEKNELLVASNETMLDFAMEFNQNLETWSTCSDEVFRLLSNFVIHGRHLEIFLNSVKTKDTIGIESEYIKLLPIWN